MSKQFAQPPEGPKIGPEKDFSELPDHRKEQLGDLEALGAKVAEAATNSPYIDELARKAAEAAMPVVMAPTPVEEVAEQVAALQYVLDEGGDMQPEVDPIDEAAEPTDDDRRDFMRCLLGSKPYAKKYTLFGGTFVIELADVTPKTEDELFAQLTVDQTEGLVKTQEDWELQLTRYRAVVNTRVILQSGHAQADAPFHGTLREKVAELCDTTNSTVYRAVMRTVRIFRRHLDIITDRSLRPDFWKVDGRNSQSEPTPTEPSDTTKTAGPEVGN